MSTSARQVMPNSTGTEEGRRATVAFVVLAAGFVLTSLDMMIANVAYPAIKANYHVSSDSLVSWMLNAYTIIYASALIPMGGVADHFGRRRMFLGGLGVFTLASVLCALAPSLPLLIAARVLQALGAAALTPTSMALLLQTFPREKHQKVIGLWASAGAMAAALAPIVGGLLVEIDWRLIFLINAPIGIAAIIVGARVLPMSPPRGGRVPDLLAGALVGIGVSALIYGLLLVPDSGVGDIGLWAWLVVAAVALVAAAMRNARAAHPMVSRSVLAAPRFGAINAAAFLYSIGFAIMLLAVVLWAQRLMGYSALQSGLSIAPGTLLMPWFAAKTPVIAARIGVFRAAALGCLLLGVGMAWWAFAAGHDWPYLAQIFPGCLFTSTGTIIGMATLAGAVARVVPPEAYAAGSAVHTTAKQLGIAVGVAVFVCLDTLIGQETGPVSGLRWSIGAGVAFEVVAAAIALYAGRPTKSPRMPTPVDKA